MYCTKCGAALPDQAISCARCGTRLAVAGDGQAETVQPVPGAPVPGEPVPGAPALGGPAPAPAPAPGAGVRRRRAAVIAAVVVVVAAALLVAGSQEHWPSAVFGSPVPPPLAWTAARAPLPADASKLSSQNSALEDVACPTAGNCVAVGYYLGSNGSASASKGLIETLSRGTWTPAAAPGMAAAAGRFTLLVGVACPSSGSCVAVGDDSGATGAIKPVTETLSGGTWTPGVPALPANADRSESAYLDDVACPAPGTCVATGWYADQGGHSQGLIDTLSGGTWKATTAPLPAGAVASTETSQLRTFLAAVVCPSAGSCVVTGQYTVQGGTGLDGLIDTLSGGTWTAARAPLPGDAVTSHQVAALWTVTCLSQGTCLAGGHYAGRGGQPRYLTETLSGGTWTPAAPPLPADAAANQKWDQYQSTSVAGVMCETAGSCLAVASYVSRNGGVDAAIDTLSGGSWSAARAPLPGGVAAAAKQNAYLTLVACPAPGTCVTVGGYKAKDGSAQGLIETAAYKRG